MVGCVTDNSVTGMGRKEETVLTKNNKSNFA
jgi:hypothetical protein